MQIFRCLRRRVAASLLALTCAVLHAQAFARTEAANFTRLDTPAKADKPIGVRGDLLLANDGNIYFTSSTGGIGSGFIGRLAADGTISTAYAFVDSKNAPSKPYAGVIQGIDGNLYGTTFHGGANGEGTVFKVSLAGQFTLLHSFGGTVFDASLPYTGLVQASDGSLYGTTFEGGSNRKGTVYRISPDGTGFAIVHHFNGTDGEKPEGRLIAGSDGLLYGTTLQGGSSNRGTIYRISIAGEFNSLYSFPALSSFDSIGIATNATGANPRAGLLLAADGNFYGTAYQGGPGGNGTVFRMTPGGTVSLLHGFAGPTRDGGFPLAAVVQDGAGNFYGTTEKGGYLNVGTAWRISSSGQFTLLHGFIDSDTDASSPQTALLLANGAAYGAAFTKTTDSLFKLDLGSNGVLPVELSVSPSEATCVSNEKDACGIAAVVTWSAPGAANCAATGAWTNATAAITGTQSVTATSAGNYTYVLTCTDGAGVVRNAYAALSVSAPPLQTVDGGGGAGAMSLPLLLLLALLVSRKNLREIFTACP